MSEPYTFLISFALPVDADPDQVAVHVYDSETLSDMALIGPDDNGVFQGDFERDGSSFADAVHTALRDIWTLMPEADILRVENDELVALAAIGRRLDRSHEAVRLYARNKRGPGNFPAPVGKIDAKTEVWNWLDVATWWTAQGKAVPSLQQDRFIKLVNDALDMRRAARHVEIADEERIVITDLIPDELVIAGKSKPRRAAAAR